MLWLLLLLLLLFSYSLICLHFLTNIWPNFYAWNCFTTCLCVLSFSINSSLNFPFSSFPHIKYDDFCLNNFSYVPDSLYYFVCFSVLYYILNIYSYDCYGFCCHTSLLFFSLVLLSIHFVARIINIITVCTLNNQQALNMWCVYVCVLESREKWNIYMWRWGGNFKEKRNSLVFTITKLKPNNEPPNSSLTLFAQKWKKIQYEQFCLC